MATVSKKGGARKCITFKAMLSYLKKYKQKHGNLEVPYNFEILNGSVKLGKWCSNIRVAYKRKMTGKKPGRKLTNSMLKELKEIGFELNFDSACIEDDKEVEHHEDVRVDFFKKLRQFSSFKISNGHCNIPSDHVLYPWCELMRKKKKEGTLGEGNVNALEAVGFHWATFDASWIILATYFSRTGHCNVPEGHVVYEWSKQMRRLKRSGSLNVDDSNLLDSIQFEWHKEDLVGEHANKSYAGEQGEGETSILNNDSFSKSRKESKKLMNNKKRTKVSNDDENSNIDSSNDENKRKSRKKLKSKRKNNRTVVRKGRKGQDDCDDSESSNDSESEDDGDDISDGEKKRNILHVRKNGSDGDSSDNDSSNDSDSSDSGDSSDSDDDDISDGEKNEKVFEVRKKYHKMKRDEKAAKKKINENIEVSNNKEISRSAKDDDKKSGEKESKDKNSMRNQRNATPNMSLLIDSNDNDKGKDGASATKTKHGNANGTHLTAGSALMLHDENKSDREVVLSPAKRVMKEGPVGILMNRSTNARNCNSGALSTEKESSGPSKVEAKGRHTRKMQKVVRTVPFLDKESILAMNVKRLKIECKNRGKKSVVQKKQVLRTWLLENARPDIS